MYLRMCFHLFQAALISEIILSKRASGKMLPVYYGYLGFGLLALFGGLFATVSLGKKEKQGPLLRTKKRAYMHEKNEGLSNAFI